MAIINIYFALAIAVITAFYYLVKRQYSYWERRGIPYIEPEFPFGNAKIISRTMHASLAMKKFYDELKGKAPFGGIFIFQRPVALLLDLSLIKRVLTKDFANFNDRGLYFNEKDDPLSAHLFSIDGKKWKNLRARLTPTFTSGKMKFMYPTVIEVADHFKDALFGLVDGEAELEIKDLLARFTTDIIGTCAFGIECNSLKDPAAEFREMGRKAFEEPRYRASISFLIGSFKNVSRFLGLKITREDVLTFFMKVVRETVDYREKNHISRNDFMDILIKLKNKKSDEDGLGALTIEEIAAQAFLFFLAGFETSSTTMTFCLYELAINPDIQEKARQEARKVIQRHDGKFTYESMTEMHYIDQVIHETLRKYPPVSNLTRGTQNDYHVPDTDFVIEKGTQVWIPIFGIQRDEQYFPDPEKFDPERFTHDEVAKRDAALWLPFGDGPRNCIGLRFGMMQTRVGLITLLNNFEFSPSSKTNIPLKIKKKGFILAPEGGMWLKLKKLQH